MSKTRFPRRTTIFRRVVSLFILVVLLDGVLLLAAMGLGGVFAQIEENAQEILTEVTRNKYQNLNAKMINWSSIDSFSNAVTDRVANTLLRLGKGYEDIAGDTALNAQLMEACAQEALAHLRTTDSTGAFVVLDGMGVPGDPDTYAGVYLSDSDALHASATNSDVLLYRGLPPLSRALGVGLDSFWYPSFRFEGGMENSANDYFYKPLLACRESGGTVARYFGFWSGRFMIDPDDNTPVLTYSRPLISPGGTVYGVVGIDVTASYVDTVIGNNDYGGHASRTCYFVGRSKDGGETYEYMLSSGVRFRQNFHEEGSLKPDTVRYLNDNEYIEIKGTRSGNDMTGAVCQIQLYDNNTVFEQERWVLIGMQENTTIYALRDKVQAIMQVVILIGLVTGVLIALVAARVVAKPFRKLARQLEIQPPAGVMTLDPTGFVEADSLADTIMTLSRNIEEEAGRISTIITLSGLPIGAFEQRAGKEGVFCAEGFFRLLGCEDECAESRHIDEDAFNALMNERLLPTNEGDGTLYVVIGVEPQRFLRMNRLRDQRGLLGTLIDVTDEVRNRRRLERERDYDLLTNLLNRRAFERRADELFLKGDAELGPVSALLMMDLDNLKVFNDVYGHDSGDLYIRTLAGVLEGMASERCLLARRSGDEFYALFHGYQNREEIRAEIERAWERIMAERFILPDGKEGRLHVSAGIAWYPDDAVELQRLIHFADFAMYRVKNTAKGTVREFSMADYREAGYLFNGSTALDQLLENRMVRFAFQPIVSAKTGAVLGYEMLMRPQVPELPTPTTVLAVARTQGKLNKLERLTWYMALEQITRMRQDGLLDGRQLTFINSIASEKLSPDDETQLVQKYGVILDNVVMEITESDKDDRNCVRHKMEAIQSHGGRVAIDDLGSGYNGEISLLNSDPAFIKLDMNIVREVDKDENRYAMVANLVQYAARRGIEVIAEGVETSGEMKTLAELGVDYYQGYYLARPALTPHDLEDEVREEVLLAAQRWGIAQSDAE